MVSSLPSIHPISSAKFYQTLLSIIFLLYALLLLHFTLAQPSSICALLQALDSSHTCRPPLEKSHTINCNISLHSIASVLDRFVLAHLFGWSIKALLIPHRPILYTASITFELLEWALTDIIPTLKECWWDSWLLDVFTCNLIGIECALYIKRCSLRKTLCYPHKRRVYSPALCTLIICAMLLTDINAFLLKHVLYIHSTSQLNLYRLGFYILLSIPASSQLHDPRPSVIPPLYPMLYVFLLSLEFLPIVTNPLKSTL